MRSASPEFETQLAESVTTLCRLWQIVPLGRDPIYLTDHDQPVTFDGHDYISVRETFSCSAIDNSMGAGQTNFEIDVLLDVVITRNDCERGAFSGASIFIDAIFYDHPDFGSLPLATGQVSTVELPDRYHAIFSCAGFASTGQHKLTEVYSATCRAEFCDTRCTLDIADFTTGPFTATSVTGTLTVAASGLDTTGGFYRLGFIEWLTGDNAGRKSEVRWSDAGLIYLLIRPAFQMQVGDTFNIAQGCAKTKAACVGYANLANFRGEPYMPGDDYVTNPTQATPPTDADVSPTPLPDTWVVP